MSQSLNTIEVSVRDARLAYDLISDTNITFTQDSTNEFAMQDEDEWNEVMEIFEENGVEIY